MAYDVFVVGPIDHESLGIPFVSCLELNLAGGGQYFGSDDINGRLVGVFALSTPIVLFVIGPVFEVIELDSIFVVHDDSDCELDIVFELYILYDFIDELDPEAF